MKRIPWAHLAYGFAAVGIFSRNHEIAALYAVACMLTYQSAIDLFFNEE